MASSHQLVTPRDVPVLPSASDQRRSSHIPGPPPSLLGWRGNQFQYLRNPIAYMNRLRGTYGDVVRLTTGTNKPMFLDSDSANGYTVFGFGAECNREILSQPKVFQKRPPRGPTTRTNKLLVNNVAMVTSQQQVDQRRAIMPAFTRQNLELFHGAMVKSAEEVLESWNEGNTVKVFDEMLALSARIAVRCIYGVEISSKYGDLAVLMRDLHDVVFNPFALIPLKLPGTPYKKSIDLGEQVYRAVCGVIELKRSSGTQGPDVMSLMLRALEENPDLMTEEQLIGNAYMMFFAGYETSSLALAWALFLLAQHPQVMADLMDELDESLGGDPPSFNQLYELPMLDRVIKETMRVLGPTVSFPRYAAVATTLGAYELPEGTEVIYSPYMTHLDPDVFPEPRRFDPSRWEHIRPSAYEYLPFGAGARSCMGTSFGSMELRLVLPMILQRFRLRVPDDCRLDIVAHILMRPRNSLPMAIQRQDRQFHKSKARVRGNILDLIELT